MSGVAQLSASRIFDYSYSGLEYAISRWSEARNMALIAARENDHEFDSSIALASEVALSKIWETPHENEEWKDL